METATVDPVEILVTLLRKRLAEAKANKVTGKLNLEVHLNDGGIRDKYTTLCIKER